MTKKLVADEIRAKTPGADIRPEVELLVCCARSCVDSETAERIRTLLQENIDWDYLIRTALSHGVMPLMYWSLNATCPEAVPKPILAQLRDYFHSNAQHSLFLTGELLKLLILFESHGLPAIPYKGPVLAASAYGNLALRQFGDLDILVHERDFVRAKNLLISQGFRLQQELSWEYHFTHDDSRVNVDLHQAIAPWYFSFRLDFERLWSRLEPLSVTGTTVPNLMPEDVLLVLCVQWAKDCCLRWERLAQLVDVAELLRVHPRLDWVRLLEQAYTLGCERMLLLDLFLASEVVGAALPEAVLNRLQADPMVKLLAQQVRSRLWCEADDLPRVLEEKTFWSFLWSYDQRFYLRMRERLAHKVMFFLYLALTLNEKDRALLPLPEVLSFLYYPLRLIRLVGKYGLGLLRRLS